MFFVDNELVAYTIEMIFSGIKIPSFTSNGLYRVRKSLSSEFGISIRSISLEKQPSNKRSICLIIILILGSR